MYNLRVTIMMDVIKKRNFWVLMTLILCILVPHQGLAMKTDDIPLPARRALIKANRFIEKKEISNAVKVLESFQEKGGGKLDPGKPDPYGYNHHLICFTLGNCYLMKNQPSQAIPNYRAAVKAKSDFSPAWLNLAKCHSDLGQHAQAGTSFLKGYDSTEEKKPEILYFSAVSFLIAGDCNRAIEIFRRLLSSHGDTTKLEWKESLIQAYINCDQHRRALPFIEELTEKTQGSKKQQWQEILLHEYLHLNMKRRALAYAQQLTRDDPLEPKWWKALAHLHLTANIYEKALVALTVYSHLIPLTNEEKKLMAELASSLGLPTQAVRFYEEILSEQMDLEIVKKIAESYSRLHRHEEALAWVEKGLQNASEESLLMLKGNLLYEIKNYRAAMKVFQSIPKGQNSGQAFLMLGYSAWQAGELEKARHAFKKASNYKKQKKTALRLLSRLEKTSGT
jgi:tetratricopeptide (TPR) repeat protein